MPVYSQQSLETAAAASWTISTTFGGNKVDACHALTHVQPCAQWNSGEHVTLQIDKPSWLSIATILATSPPEVALPQKLG
eukprot:4841056-Amphidinium_carterae.1